MKGLGQNIFCFVFNGPNFGVNQPKKSGQTDRYTHNHTHTHTHRQTDRHSIALRDRIYKSIYFWTKLLVFLFWTILLINASNIDHKQGNVAR